MMFQWSFWSRIRFTPPVWAEKNESSPKSSIYSAVPQAHAQLLHPLILKLDHPNSKVRDPQILPPPNANTHTSQETQCLDTTFPQRHTHKPATHKQMRWSAHSLNAHSNKQKHIHFSLSHMFKHTVYTEVKGDNSRQTKANSSHIHNQGSLHAFTQQDSKAVFKGGGSGLQLCCLSVIQLIDPWESSCYFSCFAARISGPVGVKFKSRLEY